MNPRIANAALAVFALALVSGACDDPVSSSDTHNSPPVAGLVIVADGQEVVSIDAQRNVEGELAMAAGAELEIEVRFLGANGDPLNPDPAEFSVHFEMDDASVAEFHRTSAFAGHVVGLSGGDTTGVLELIHGADEGEHEEEEHEEEGHADYTSPPVPVVVSAN